MVKRQVKEESQHTLEFLEEHYIKTLPMALQELSDASGISRNTLYKKRSRSARITANIAVRLSKIFNTTPEL